MKLTKCYVCGEPCKDWECGTNDCCLACAKIVHAFNGNPTAIDKHTDPMDGDSFSKNSNWDAGIVEAQKQRGKAMPANLSVQPSKKPDKAVSVKKDYGNQCPCGIYPSQCDYHRP